MKPDACFDYFVWPVILLLPVSFSVYLYNK